MRTPKRSPKDPLGERLRAERTKRDFGQKELAQRAGISPSLVSMIESGDRPNPGRKIIEALEHALAADGEPPVRLLYDGDQGGDATFDAFLAHPLGQSLEIGDEEREELRQFRWYFPGEAKPTPQHWYDFVRLRRSMKRKDC